MSKPVTGLHTHRFADNPEEKRFAEAYAAKMGRRNLEWLLSCGGEVPAPLSERDETVAATMIQWLGSPVGQGFLRDLGYERKT